MYINGENLGFRETTRLIQFIDYMITKHPEECIDVTFEYNMKYDEPCYSFGFNTIYATDQNVGFTASNELVNLD